MNLKNKTLNIYTDGGARGNPGPAGIGVVICVSSGKCQRYSRYIGQATNNQAEYQAVIFALQRAKKLKAQKIHCFLDSELVARQLNGKYKVKNRELKPLFAQVWELASSIAEIKFAHIPRKQNQQADKLVNRAIDQALK